MRKIVVLALLVIPVALVLGVAILLMDESSKEAADEQRSSDEEPSEVPGEQPEQSSEVSSGPPTEQSSGPPGAPTTPGNQVSPDKSSPSKTGLSITVIYDNYPYTKGLKTNWGFSCLIRGPEKTILFDTGRNGLLLMENMGKLGIDAQEIDAIVLSHIHGDHTGGLDAVLQQNSSITVYVLQSFPPEFTENIKEYGASVVAVSEPVSICENVYTTGEMGTRLKEQALIVSTEKGLIVIAGCAHPGISRMVKRAKDLYQDDILFVMGGFHLVQTAQEDIEEIIYTFKELGVKYVGPCHCTGDTARDLFEEEYKKNFIYIGVGKIITMEDFE